jgi:cobalamin-dependent methionine synthase I
VHLYNGHILAVSTSETKRYAGIKNNQHFPELLIQKACLDAQLLAKPQGIYAVFPYDDQYKLIQSTNPFQLTGKNITNHLAKCHKVALMAVTIGSAIETQITRHFSSGNYTAGLLLDAAATTAVESLADQVNSLIDTLAVKAGYTTTWRFSPGYGDWDVRIQQALLLALDAQVINLTTTESMMLTPRKSVTAAIGLRPNDSSYQQGRSKTTCANCTQKTCIARKENII